MITNSKHNLSPFSLEKALSLVGPFFSEAALHHEHRTRRAILRKLSRRLRAEGFFINATECFQATVQGENNTALARGLRAS